MVRRALRRAALVGSLACLASPVAAQSTVVPGENKPFRTTTVPASERVELPATTLTRSANVEPVRTTTPVVATVAPLAPTPTTPECGWFAAEMLCWRFSANTLPPLVTTSPAGTPAAAAGVIGVPGNSIALAGDDFGSRRIGMRYSGGLWLDDCRRTGLDVSVFFLEPQTTGRLYSSDGSTILARPLFDVTTNANISKLVGFPGIVAGTVDVQTRSEIWGLEANARRALHTDEHWRIEGFMGYRFLRLTERIDVFEADTVIGAAAGLPVGATLALHDRFRTQNTFNGVQVGFTSQATFGAFKLLATTKAAVGNMNQTLDIGGQTILQAGGTTAPFQGGLLALGSNIGNHERNRFAVIPEMSLAASYRVSSHLSLTAGYSALYVSDVVRPADQIDGGINPALLPPAVVGAQPARPALWWRTSDLWLHGWNVGLQVSW